jgi:hypothetical protein
MTSNAPAIVTMPRILLARDMLTRIYPSQSVDGALVFRTERRCTCRGR